MEKTGKKPNIIMILADDQGPWAMHCAGTPELLYAQPGQNCRTGNAV